MSNFVSIPVNPVQPAAPQYPATVLKTVPEFTLQSYQTTFGVSAPKFDNTRPIQAWGDTSVLDPNNFTYQFQFIGADANGNPILQTKTILAAWVANVNLPAETDTVPQNYPTLPTPVRPLITGASAETLFVSPDAAGPGISEVMVSRADQVSASTVGFTNVMANQLAMLAALAPRLAAYLSKQGS